ncbi:MAG: helix-turn-helix transcriptional regulator, partial [Chloroflexi bacterium]|nr:helix-turn-helix transcriptional regulator [Chloroflexota bacterium]
ARKWSQREFGQRIGLSKTQVNHLFTGRQNWSVERLIKASEVLGLPVSYLFGQGNESWLEEDLEELLRAATPEDRRLITEMLRRFLSRN